MKQNEKNTRNVFLYQEFITLIFIVLEASCSQLCIHLEPTQQTSQQRAKNLCGIMHSGHPAQKRCQEETSISFTWCYLACYFSIEEKNLFVNRNKILEHYPAAYLTYQEKQIHTDIQLLFCSALGISSPCKTYAPCLKG